MTTVTQGIQSVSEDCRHSLFHPETVS